jgi:DNA modification methylase
MVILPKQKEHPANASRQIAEYLNRIIGGDSLKVLKTIPSESVDCVVTSPPYWTLRDYQVQGQIGLEPTIEEYLEKLLAVFAEMRRVLKPSGTCWVNFGDTYADKNNVKFSVPPKSLCLIPSRFALKMIEQGWILRNEIIWHKPNAMPQSVADRFTVDFEKIFFFVKSQKYYFRRQYEPLKNPPELKRRFSNPFGNHKYWNVARKRRNNLAKIKRNQTAILKKGRNKRCVWSIGTGVSNAGHFAVYPPRLIETPIKAGCPKGGIVLDPFVGSGTTAVVARKLNRNFIGIELNPDYARLARSRIKNLTSSASEQ